MANKALTALRKLEGIVNMDAGDPLKNCLQSPSPSVNWAFSTPGQGLPFGTGMVLYGPPKGGKSLIVNAMIGEMHRQDPEAIAVVFNTELRGEFQANAEQLKKWGVDTERFITYDVNTPELIFDRIEHDLNSAIQEGLKIKLIVIDSLTAIIGRRTLNADTVSQQQIGDQAATIKDGLMRILPVIRKHKIALIGTAHVRAEMDQKEQMRGKTVKMATSWAAKHTFEFFCYVEPNRSKDGRVSLAGEEFTDKESTDFMDNSQKTGHKIRFKVEETSFGHPGRVAEFTLDYDKGVINKHEEIFTLAKNSGVIVKPNNVTYQYKDKTWRGIAACLTALRDDEALSKEILAEVYKKDQS
jgi:RecA/RadA recombinase